MKINEVEQAIGITKKNIRFYEDAGLLNPSRSANGYRDYSEADLTTLRQIKLFRKLDIPIEEIKQLLSGRLTLEDCLERHLIVLKRRVTNLTATEGFCQRLTAEHYNINNLPVGHLLDEMDKMEEGGTKFVNVQHQDKRKQKSGAILGTIPVILFMLIMISICIWGVITDSGFPLPLAILFIGAPAIVIIATIFALRQRMKEIERGELDEASKY